MSSAQPLGHVRLFVVPWTAAHQAPLSKEFSRQEYWSGLPFPSPEDLPHLVIKPVSPASPALQADSLPTEPLINRYLLGAKKSFLYYLLTN